ncbi:hypothetical protein SADFL11_00009870 [Roseibium alexandrii DFL-11]|uniref:Uncharacterized protein n=1 Tax=Roseibium alexandrii (strain DSM 17067 / NCIMB 14079 / DFL-11) TaxID=244592 RepID=A0A5E8UWN3_ROSAD|nr:hypothetical protein SADFL11_00009870 [Roseibium alexandrii DFL-11]
MVGKTGQKATVHGGLILGWHPAGQISSLWVGTKSVKRLTGQQSYLSDAMFRSGKSCDFSSRLKVRSDLCEYNERLSARLRSDGWTIKGGRRMEQLDSPAHCRETTAAQAPKRS